MLNVVLAIISLMGYSRADGFYYQQGRLSVYAPGDGQNAGRLACGSKVFTRQQIHIAFRRWHQVGCGRNVWVYAEDTGKGAFTTVQDAGPFGIFQGPLERCVSEKRWKVWTKLRPPRGWEFRGVADLSWGLWTKLGRPKFLSKVHLLFLPQEGKPRRR